LRGDPGSRGELDMMQSNLQAANAKPTWENNGKLAWMEGVGMAADLMQMAKDAGGDIKNISPENKEKLLKARRSMAQRVGEDPSKIGWDDVLATYDGVREGAMGTQREINDQIAKQVGRNTQDESRFMRAGGIAAMAGDNLHLVTDPKKIDAITKKDGAAVAQAMQQAVEVQNLGMEVSLAKNDEERAEKLGAYHAATAAQSDSMSKMSVKELRAFTKHAAGTEAGAEGMGMLMRGQAIEGHKKKRGGGGAAGAIAGTLGLDFSPEELKKLAAMSVDDQAAAIMKRGGLEGDAKFKEGLTASIAAAGKKGGGIQAAHLLDVAKAGASEETRKKLVDKQKGEPSADDKIIEKIGEGNKFLEAMVKSSKEAQAALQEISGNTKKVDAE